MPPRLPITLIAVLASCLALVPPTFAAPAGRKPIIVSRQSKSAGAALADADSGAPDASANGRYVVFESRAQNLSPIAKDVRNVYLYDTERRRVELVSRDRGVGANGRSWDPAVSRNGRWVAFTSKARNLSGPTPGAYLSVYVYDAKRNRTELVSRQSRSDGGRAANGWSEVGDISADGSTVSFTTTADNLGGPIAVRKNVYVYDREQHRVELVSRRSGGDGGGGANRSSLNGSYLSASGRFVAFASKATNLGGPAKGLFRGYVYDRKRDRVRPIAPAADDRDSYSYPEAITGDGRRVAFYVYGAFGGGSFAYELRSGDRRRIGREGAADLSLNGRFAAGIDKAHKRVDGRRVRFERVFRLDLRSGRRTIVSAAFHRPGGDERLTDATEPSISGRGGAVAFTDAVSPLVGGPRVPDLVVLRRYR